VKKILLSIAVMLGCIWIMSLNAAPPAPMHSEIRLRGAASPSPVSGYGSTGVYVRVFHFSTVTGSDIIYNHDLTNGDSLTINATGVYTVSYTGTSPFADILGISINQDPTQYLIQLGKDQVPCAATIYTAGFIASCSATLALNTGDVIRAHRNIGGTQGCNCDTNEDEKFIISEIKGL